MGPYPGAPDAFVTGTVSVRATNSGLVMSGTLSGLPASTSCGLHIHNGTTCATSGGHWYNTPPDPWNTTIASDANGTATFSISMPAQSLGFDPRNSLGHAVVVHNGSTGNRIACGVLVLGSPASPPAAATDAPSSPLGTGAVVGIVVGILVVLIIAIVCVVRMRSQRDDKDYDLNTELTPNPGV